MALMNESSINIGDVVYFPQSEQTGIIMSFSDIYANVLFSDLTFASVLESLCILLPDAPYCNVCQDKISDIRGCPDCMNLISNFSETLLSFKLCTRYYNSDHSWSLPRIQPSSPQALTVSLNFQKQIDRCFKCDKKDHVTFVYLEGNEFPHRSTKGRVLFYVDLCYAYEVWMFVNEIYSPFLDAKIKKCLVSIVEKFNHQTISFDEDYINVDVIQELMIEYGFVALSIQDCKSGTDYSRLHSSVESFIEKGTMLDFVYV